MRNLYNGTPVEFTLSGTLGNNDNIRVMLVPTVVTENAATYEADVNYMNNTFTLTDVPTGRYNVRLDVVRTRPTQENDGNAGGVIRVIRRKTAVEVSVE